jgi:exopolyphosphatase/guanosine-5'-triphosphate,3'-diphosphate pyrophosphatase
VRAACIDIGSNTTRLLVADSAGTDLVEIYQERAFTRIGRGLTGSGVISAEKIAEVVEVVAAQIQAARRYGAAELRGVATAAIRAAANGDELIEAIRHQTGLVVEIVSGEAEARLAFLGATSTMDARPEGELGVIDVGGGSSELVVGSFPGQIRWWRSIDIGSGALTDHCLPSDPPTDAELAAARAEIAAALAGLEPPRPRMAVAVGGSATSLCRLAGATLDAPAFARSLALLAGAPAADVAERYLIDPQRARLLPAGLLILEAAGRLLGATLSVGRGGIREGVLLEALQR